jgi:hypothetical protein
MLSKRLNDIAGYIRVDSWLASGGFTNWIIEGSNILLMRVSSTAAIWLLYTYIPSNEALVSLLCRLGEGRVLEIEGWRQALYLMRSGSRTEPIIGLKLKYVGLMSATLLLMLQCGHSASTAAIRRRADMSLSSSSQDDRAQSPLRCHTLHHRVHQHDLDVIAWRKWSSVCYREMEDRWFRCKYWIIPRKKRQRSIGRHYATGVRGKGDSDGGDGGDNEDRGESGSIHAMMMMT